MVDCCGFLSNVIYKAVDNTHGIFTAVFQVGNNIGLANDWVATIIASDSINGNIGIKSIPFNLLRETFVKRSFSIEWEVPILDTSINLSVRIRSPTLGSLSLRSGTVNITGIIPDPVVFHSFNINAVNPSYIENRVKIGLKYFIAGDGRCSAGQCGGETMQFFMQVKDADTKSVLGLFKQAIPLPDAFGDTINFDEIISPAPGEILVELFMWDINNIAMSETFSFFITKEAVPEPDPVPITNMIAQVLLNPKLENNTVSGTVELTTTNTFDPFFFNKTQTHFIQLKNISGQVIDLVPKDVIFSAQFQTKTVDFSLSAQGNKTIIIESFIWDSQKRAFSQIISKQVDEISVEPDPNTNMLLVTSQNFKIENNRVLGSVAIVATSDFNPFFNDLPLTLFTQIKNPSGEVLVLKPNSIFFNDTVREQNIDIDESAFDETKVTVELFVWDSLTRAFSNVVTFDLEVPEPPGADPNSFRQDFTIVEYKSTELGKSLFAQIQVTKLIEPPDNLINSFLQVKTQGGKVVNLENQEINVAGVNQFAIVYDIPDLNQPTATITIEHFLQTKEFIPLSDVIQVTRTIDVPVKPVPKDGDNFFSKIVGIWAGMTAGALMLSRGRN